MVKAIVLRHKKANFDLGQWLEWPLMRRKPGYLPTARAAFKESERLRGSGLGLGSDGSG